MRTFLIILGSLALAACAGSKGNSEVMTPEERLEEQLRIAEEQRDVEDQSNSSFDEASTTAEEEAKFDEESAEHEMKRASLNAVDCPNTFEKSQLGDYSPGKAEVTMMFLNDGSVNNVSVGAPYSGTPVGDCIVRAMGTVKIEPFKGAEVPKTRELELAAPKPKAAPPKK
jgi:hypothetical protein